jgi:2-succinyl-6-hydroxy-2,4-cyclohexadiene-1-carboxylate synthase
MSDKSIWLGVEQRAAARKSGPALFMLHGFRGSSVSWGRQLETLVVFGLRLIALDLPDHGHPTDPQRYAI